MIERFAHILTRKPAFAALLALALLVPAVIAYLASEEAKEEKLLENQSWLKTPIVRNGKQATLGVQTEIWKQWEAQG